MFPYSGTSRVTSEQSGETLIVVIDTKVAFNTVTAKSTARILLSPLRPLSIFSDYSKVGVKSAGYLIFNENSIDTYSSDAKVKEKNFKAAYQPNDWLILPYFLKYYDKEEYQCSMIHGNFLLKKSVTGGREEWSAKNGGMIVVFEDGVFTYLKAGKIEMKRSK